MGMKVMLTTRRKRGSRSLNRVCMFLCIMASRITLELFNANEQPVRSLEKRMRH